MNILLVGAAFAALIFSGCSKPQKTVSELPSNTTVLEYDWRKDPRCLDDQGNFDEGFGGDDFDCANMDESKWAK